MRKFFSFVAAALFAGSMVAETVFSFTVTSSTTAIGSYADGAAVLSGSAMATSGSNEVTVGEQTFYKFNSSTKWTFTIEEALQVDDVITLTVASNASSEKKGKGVIINGVTMTAASIPAAGTATISYTVVAEDGIAGATTLEMVRADSDIKFGTITITGDRGPLTYHTVTYALGAGTGTAPTQADVAEGRKFDVASFEGCTAPEGQEFNGWNDGTNTYAAGDKYTMGTADVTLTAQYKTYVPKYTVSFYVDGTLYETQTVEDGSRANMPDEPTKDLYNFVGWFNGQDQYFFDPIHADLTLNAHFEEMGDASDLDFEQFVMDNGKDLGFAKGYINFCNFSYNLTEGDDLDSLDASKTKNNYQFLGLKLKHNGSYLIGKVAAGKRVDLVLGQLNNVKVLVNDVEAAAPNGGVEADSTAGHKTYDFRQAGTFKVLCTGTKTLVIKAIKFTDLPSVSDDVTLSALTLDGVAIAGFDAAKTSYKVTLPEGTVELPVVVATANDANATVGTINYSAIEDYAATATFTVTAEDGEHTATYTINFTIEKPIQYLQAPYESVMTADFELPDWLRGCAVNLNYNGSDTAVIADQENRHHVIRFEKTDTISMYIASCDSVILDLSATGTRTVAIAVNGEEKANSGSFGKNTLKTLSAFIHSQEPVIVKVYGVNVTGGTTISRIKVTAYGTATGVNEMNAVKATKAIVNGKVVILRDGKAFNLLGGKL